MNKTGSCWLLVAIVIAHVAPARAANDGDRCDAILQQDLFNRVSNSSQSSSSERAAYEEHLFSMGETEAYEEYRTALASHKKQATSGATEFHYGVIGGELEFSHSYDNELSSDDFGKRFNKAKQQYDHKKSSSTARDTSLISLYQSSVRDPASVKAWENCMTSGRAGPGLIAYGYRDPGGRPYIVVMWAPGSYAVSTPVIDVTFGVTETGMSIEGVSGKVQIGTGSGAAYPIRFSDPDDRRAIADGFVVLVNGELKGGANLQSFRSEATVPRMLGPTPCRLTFAANRVYQMGFFNPDLGQMQWVGDFSTLDLLPGDEGGELVYRLDMRDRSQSFLRIAGTGLRFTQMQRMGRGSAELTEKTVISGECSGQGVQGRILSLPSDLDAPKLIIQAR
jgi:hypothetical protein